MNDDQLNQRGSRGLATLARHSLLFLLMDEEWQARRLRLGFDLANV